MTEFEKVKFYYDQGWATKDDVATYVFYKKITPEEYETITGEPYVPREQ